MFQAVGVGGITHISLTIQTRCDISSASCAASRANNHTAYALCRLLCSMSCHSVILLAGPSY